MAQSTIGLVIYERVKNILADVDELKTIFKSGASQAGRVRVDVSSRMARLEIIPRLSEFIAAHPGIEVELGATDRNVDLVYEGYDCVIRGGRPSDSSLVGRQIGAARIINVASAGYLQRYGTPRSLKDLERHYSFNTSRRSAGEPMRSSISTETRHAPSA